MSGINNVGINENPYREEALREPRRAVRQCIEDATNKGEFCVRLACSLPVEIIKELKCDGYNVRTDAVIEEGLQVTYYSYISWENPDG